MVSSHEKKIRGGVNHRMDVETVDRFEVQEEAQQSCLVSPKHVNREVILSFGHFHQELYGVYRLKQTLLTKVTYKSSPMFGQVNSIGSKPILFVRPLGRGFLIPNLHWQERKTFEIKKPVQFSAPVFSKQSFIMCVAF